MTLEERGLYTDLLDIQASEGSIPRDKKAIQRMAAASDEEFERAWPRVSECFVPHLTDRLINLKLKEILGDRESYSKGQSERGRKGAKARWQTPKRTPSKRDGKKMPEEKRREESKRTPDPKPKHPHGEFGHALFSDAEYIKLQDKLGDQLSDYIERFDLWVEEAPDAKASGAKRRSRNAYASILAWHRRDVQGGNRGSQNGKRTETTAEASVRNMRELRRKAGRPVDDAGEVQPHLPAISGAGNG